MSATNAGSIVGKPEEKRKIILTEKAMMNKIESIQKERKRKVDEIKRLILSLKELMRDEKNVSLVKSQLDVLMQLSVDATALRESLILLIPTDEQQKQNEWFSKVNKHKEGCIKDVEAWFKITNVPPNKPLSETHMSGRSQQQEASAVEKEAQWDVGNGKELQFHQNPHNDDHDEITPFDSISNKGSVKHGTRSNVSSTASARLRAEAEMAALLARQRLFKEKHALEEQIRKRKEQLQLEAEIAASMAKVNVLRTAGSSSFLLLRNWMAWSLILRRDLISMQSLLYQVKMKWMEEDRAYLEVQRQNNLKKLSGPSRGPQCQ